MKNKGFTLLEVLITVVILAIGLLGLAGLQVNGMKNNLSAEQRGLASQLAYDMADRIRGNREEAILFNTSAYVGTALTAASAAVLTCNTAATACAPITIAQKDLSDWTVEANRALPLAALDISTSISASGSIFSITVNWDDNRDGTTDASDAGFNLRFTP